MKRTKKKTTKTSKAGFSSAIGIVIVVAIALIVGGVFYYLSIQTKNDNTNTITSIQTNNNTNTVASTNLNDDLDANLNRNTNSSVNLNTNSLVTNERLKYWDTYTDTIESVSFKYPPDLRQTSISTSTHIQMNNFYNIDEYNDRYLPTLQLGMYYIDFEIQTNQAQSWCLQDLSNTSKTTIDSVEGTRGQKIDDKGNVQYILCIERNGINYKLQTTVHPEQGSIAELVLSTFQFTGIEDLQDLEVEDISGLFSGFGGNGIETVNINGSTALIGGTNSKLFQYDSNGVVDLTNKLPLVDRPEYRSVANLRSNGQNWIISLVQSPNAPLLEFDGNTMINLSSQMPNSSGLTGFDAIGWNGQYWLLGNRLGQLIRYDGSTFTDLTSQIPDQLDNNVQNIEEAIWDGARWLILTYDGKAYWYNGDNITRVSALNDYHISKGAWNGSYWLLGTRGQENAHVYKFDGNKTVTDTGEEMSVTTIASDKKYWYIGTVGDTYVFDGEKFTNAKQIFYRAQWVQDIAIGLNYNLLVSQNQKVIKFTVKD
ncbi:MAG: hypothetical protein PHI73_02255 [Patescibacteria group bacterium]|nr:hypothetical protein [Patescibacteria group bacterium]